MSRKYHYQCTDCGQVYADDGAMYLCPSCAQSQQPMQPPKGVLKTVYDYDTIRKIQSGEVLFNRLQKENFLSLLPLKSLDCWPTLRVGNTPLYKIDGIYETDETDEIDGIDKKGKFEVYLKDDSQNPTFSFKDRASALVSAWARENGISTIIAASTGNAGSSLAGICASQGQRSVIFVPASAPVAKLTQIMMYGATIVPVNGTYDQAFDLSAEATRQMGFYNRNTAYNPLTIEGKKTVSFEIFAGLDQQVPDRIFVPVGDGVIISGVYKGFEDLLLLGIIDKMPVMVAVQAEGSCNLVNNIGKAEFSIIPSSTLADSISVDIPRNFRMAAGFLEKYKGEWITVSDREILEASVELSKRTGIFTEPASAAAFAGMRKYSNNGKISTGTKNVVLLTGSGLKDLKSVQSCIRMPAPVDPVPESLGKLFKHF